VEPENFWELLARRKRLELCLGVRASEQWPEGAWVVASDSLLAGRLHNGVSTLGGTAKFRKAQFGQSTTPEAEAGAAQDGALPHPEDIKQTLVWAPGQKTEQEVQARAREVYKEFNAVTGDRAMVSLGSVKSNPLIEIAMAGAFGCEPFQSQDECEKPSERVCPIFLKYRQDRPPHPASCHGGLQLAKSQPGEDPGIYYENVDGTWSCCRWEENQCEPAIVFYTYREAQGRLEMVLGGFTGHGTRLLSKTLASRAEEFWPPTYNGHGIQIGAFVVEFTLRGRKEDHNILAPLSAAVPRFIRVNRRVIERRMAAQNQ